MLLCSNVYFYHNSFILERYAGIYQVFVTIGDILMLAKNNVEKSNKYRG
jgi:hypothetical protein